MRLRVACSASSLSFIKIYTTGYISPIKGGWVYVHQVNRSALRSVIQVSQKEKIKVPKLFSVVFQHLCRQQRALARLFCAKANPLPLEFISLFFLKKKNSPGFANPPLQTKPQGLNVFSQDLTCAKQIRGAGEDTDFLQTPKEEPKQKTQCKINQTQEQSGWENHVCHIPTESPRQKKSAVGKHWENFGRGRRLSCSSSPGRPRPAGSLSPRPGLEPEREPQHQWGSAGWLLGGVEMNSFLSQNTLNGRIGSEGGRGGGLNISREGMGGVKASAQMSNWNREYCECSRGRWRKKNPCYSRKQPLEN